VGGLDERHVIRTANATLRPVSMGDLGPLHRLWTHPDMRRFFWDDEVIPQTRAEATIREAVEGFERHGFGLWVAEGADGALLGFCGLRHLDDGPEVEVLYGVAPSEWGRGLATEMALAMLRHGFERVGLPVILGIADTANTASRRVLEKIGMTFERYASHGGREEAHYSIRPEAFRLDDRS
jgi:ribosomal-protein-alanine N-acetyltransferase